MRLQQALMEPEHLVIHQEASEITAKVTIPGKARGVLIGGNLNMIGRAIGWTCPGFADAILLLEAVDTEIGRSMRS